MLVLTTMLLAHFRKNFGSATNNDFFHTRIIEFLHAKDFAS